MVCNETLSKGAANEDLRVQAQKRLDDVFDDIFSVHFVTKGFGYVCCGAQTPTLRGFSQGRTLFPLYGDSSWQMASVFIIGWDSQSPRKIHGFSHRFDFLMKQRNVNSTLSGNADIADVKRSASAPSAASESSTPGASSLASASPKVFASSSVPLVSTSSWDKISKEISKAVQGTAKSLSDTPISFSPSFGFRDTATDSTLGNFSGNKTTVKPVQNSEISSFSSAHSSSSSVEYRFTLTKVPEDVSKEELIDVLRSYLPDRRSPSSPGRLSPASRPSGLEVAFSSPGCVTVVSKKRESFVSLMESRPFILWPNKHLGGCHFSAVLFHDLFTFQYNFAFVLIPIHRYLTSEPCHNVTCLTDKI